MDSYQKRKWRILRDYSLGWMFAFIFLSIVRGVGTVELGELRFDPLFTFVISCTVGPLLGLFSGYSQIFIEERMAKRYPIIKLLAFRILYTFIFLCLLACFAYFAYSLYFDYEIDATVFIFNKGSFVVYFYVLFIDLFLYLLRQVNMMLGSGNLRKLLLGQFYSPREEYRIFMFLDLQSSTKFAEELGNLKYSLLIQDCFNDMGVVVENGAEIYQYVGDEAVLTWKTKEGVKNQNCLKAFYRFKQQIEYRSEYYKTKYGVVPFFKAGMHSGIVTVTEIGRYKKEIAYHGDPVNTTARIQGQCNRLGSDLLISQKLRNQLGQTGFMFKKLGSFPLKGKKKNIIINSVAAMQF